MKLRLICLLLGCLSLPLSLAAQTAVSSSASAQVPPLIQFSNVATDSGGNTLSGPVSITFSLYTAQQGGEPLWTETQINVPLDSTGHYSVQLGITKPNGVPTALFTSGEARWLGVRIAEQVEQPRVLLLSVPYALKAGDAATIGGLPPSAFVLAAPAPNAVAADANAALQTSTPPSTGGPVTGTGTANFLPLWDSTSDIISSVLFQSGTGSTAKIGINTATPATTLDIKGSGTVRGILSLPATGTAAAAAGRSSQPLSLTASAFNSSAATAVNQVFRWQAEPAGNDTATPSGTLNLLFGEGSTAPSETGFHIASNGLITFATGQTFPGTGGSGTVTSVATGLGLKGGPITTSGTLTIDATVVPQLAAANTFTANQTINANLSVPNTTTGGTQGVIEFAGVPFIHNYGPTGSFNAFFGRNAGSLTNTGGGLTAVGDNALVNESSGSFNTALGYNAGAINTTGSSNTLLGYSANPGANNLSNATAIGANAVVSESNALVLGALGVSVGIGTTTPAAPLHINGPAEAPPDAIAAANSGLLLGLQSTSGYKWIQSYSGPLAINPLGNNVGIGTATPTSTLDVNGTATFTGAVTFASGQTFPGVAGLGSANIFTANQTVNGNITATLGISAANVSASLSSVGNSAVFGQNLATSGTGTNGGSFFSSSPQGAAVVGVNTAGGSAAFFEGPATVTGNLSLGGNTTMSGTLSIGGDTPMSHNPHMAFSGFITSFGAFGNCQNACAGFFIPDQGITITRVTASIASPGSNCSNPAGLQVQNFDDTAIYADVSLPNSANFADSGPISSPVPAGTQIAIVGFSASGCTAIIGQSPGNVFINVQYAMQ
jgi:hypothetical protein